ncbi:hypothetical protein Q5752_003950 [Cryptotrichosporon argae]
MSDWWTQPSSTSANPFTPTRATLAHSAAGPLGSSSRARFVNDDLDPTDLGASESVRFLPSFASSPAGKLALGTSPGSTASPPAAARKSPTVPNRLSTLNESAHSPRAPRRPHPVLDDDLPPTTSLHDAPRAVATITPPSTLPPPPALQPTSSTIALHVFGPPLSVLPSLRPFFESIGPVVSYAPGPDGTNWFVVEFADPLSASYALRRHGEIVLGRYMLGLKVAGPGSTAGLTLVPGVPVEEIGTGFGIPQGAQTGSGAVALGGAGTPMRVQNREIMRPRPAAKTGTEAVAWEDERAPSGILGKAAEFIFGR